MRVNGRRAAKGMHLAAGDRVTLPGPARRRRSRSRTSRSPSSTRTTRVVVLDKPGGMPSHALDPRERGTAAAFVLARYPEMAAVGDPLAPGLVHRLDTGTSGLLLAARTPTAHARLRAALRAASRREALPRAGRRRRRIARRARGRRAARPRSARSAPHGGRAARTRARGRPRREVEVLRHDARRARSSIAATSADGRHAPGARPPRARRPPRRWATSSTAGPTQALPAGRHALHATAARAAASGRRAARSPDAARFPADLARPAPAWTTARLTAGLRGGGLAALAAARLLRRRAGGAEVVHVVRILDQAVVDVVADLPARRADEVDALDRLVDALAVEDAAAQLLDADAEQLLVLALDLPPTGLVLRKLFLAVVGRRARRRRRC